MWFSFYTWQLLNDINDIDVILEEKSYKVENENVSKEQSKNSQNHNSHPDSCYSTKNEPYQDLHVYPLEHKSFAQSASIYPELIKKDKKEELENIHNTVM